jgi:hypothetical protein
VTFLDQPEVGADLSRRAISALEAVVRDEGFLQWMQLTLVGESLDRRDLRLIVHDGKRQA